MSDATLWWLVAGAAVGAELVTGTFYLLMVAVGLAAGAVAAHLGLDLTGQLTAAAVVGGGAVVVWHRLRKRHGAPLPARANRDVNMDIGATVHIAEWQSDGTAQVKYRGAAWTAALMPGAGQSATGQYRIEQVVGSRLLVVPA